MTKDCNFVQKHMCAQNQRRGEMTPIYLTVLELSTQIKYSEQSIYNLICNGTLIEGKHFFKPTPKKVLFKWQAIVEWIEGERNSTINTEGCPKSTLPARHSEPEAKTSFSSINI